MKIYLATWLLEKAQGDSLTTKDGKKRLVSYFHTKEKKDDFADYIKTGKNPK
jgi:hypothetical protein